MIMANKRDLTDNLIDLDEIEDKMDLDLLRKDGRFVKLQECSALQGDGVWEGLAELI